MMSKPQYVVDASVLYRIITGGIDAADYPGGMAAPMLLKVEITNILWKYVKFNKMLRNEAAFLRSKFHGFPITFHDDALLLDAAWDISLAYDLTVYDSLYAALAQREKTTLLTADRRLADKAQNLGVATSFIAYKP